MPTDPSDHTPGKGEREADRILLEDVASDSMEARAETNVRDALAAIARTLLALTPREESRADE